MTRARATETAGAPSPRRGRPPRIGTDQIVEAALELGLDRFSMQSIARRLGVTPPALYSHVRGRDEVLERVTAHLLERLTVPEGAAADWRAWLRAFGHAVRRQLADAGPTLRVDLSGPLAAQKLAASERGLQLLIDAGFPPADAGRALWLVFRVALSAGPEEAATVTGPMSATRRVLDPLEHPATERALDALEQSDELDTFEFDLRVVIDGLARTVSLGQGARV